MAAVPAESTQPLKTDVVDEKNLVDLSNNPKDSASSSEKDDGASQTALSSANSEKPVPAEPLAGGLQSVPFPHSLPTCKPVSLPELTSEQATKYNDLLKTVSSWTTIPDTSARNPSTAPLNDDERMWLTREQLLRYLRASKWNLSQAAQRLQATMTWRREYGLANFTPEYISVENETGKQVILGFDNDARPCLYMNPAKQNTQKSDRQLHHLVFMLERVIDLMEPGQETTALLINFKDSSSGSGPSVAQGKQTLNILQGHYPERLGRSLISDLPWYITTFFRLISPFIDPVTKSKMKFNEPLRNHVPSEQLQKDYGGDVDFQYDHSVYWPALCQLAEQRRLAYTERWVAAGKKVGESEFLLRGGGGESIGVAP